MNQLREATRLCVTTKRSGRKIARTVGLSHTAVNKYRKILKKTGKSWRELNALDDNALEVLLGASPKQFKKKSKRVPDWNYIREQLALPDMTLMLIWEEYRLENPSDAYSYSQFAFHYRRHLKKSDVSMRQSHKAGDKLFVDYGGRTVPYFDRETDEEKRAQIFVAAMGCSNYTFAYASASQQLHDFIEAHVKTYRFLGGVPATTVPDNLRSAVSKACSVPVINPTYLEMAQYYNTVIEPARVRRPQDKAKAEVAVQIVSRWILARLRNRKFFSIAEINKAIAELLIQLNERPFKKMPGCRRSRFEEIDKPALQELPAEPFDPSVEWYPKQTVSQEYNVFVDGHFYSVPNELVGSKVEIRVTRKMVEIFFRGKRIALHIRSYVVNGQTVDPAHQTPAHRAYADQTPEKLLAWAKSVGTHTLSFVETLFDQHPYVQPVVRTCASLQKLAKTYGHDRLELACKRAERINSYTLTSVKNILRSKLDTLDETSRPVQGQLPLHHNVRGANYYSSPEV